MAGLLLLFLVALVTLSRCFPAPGFLPRTPTVYPKLFDFDPCKLQTAVSKQIATTGVSKRVHRYWNEVDTIAPGDWYKSYKDQDAPD